MADVRRFFQDSPSSYFLFGPRGTGKSTWLRLHHPHALWVDLLDPEAHRLYAARPERLRDLVRAHPESEVVVVDRLTVRTPPPPPPAPRSKLAPHARAPTR